MTAIGKPALLFLSPRFLYPFDQGGRIRTANILRHLKGGAFATVLASPVPPDWRRWQHEIDGIADRFLHWPAPLRSSIGRTLSLASSLPVGVVSDRSSIGRGVVTAALAARPALIVIDFPHAEVLLPSGPLPPSVLFTHNVEAEIFDRHAGLARGPMRLVWRDQARKMDRFERRALARADTVIAVSPRDAAALGARYGVPHAVPIATGVDLEFYAYDAPGTATLPDGGGTIVFSGAMDVRANIDGVEFLLREIWPLVTATRPDARAVIVGRNPPAALVAMAAAVAPGVRFTGFVDDVRPHVRAAAVSVIPLRVGSGTRLKAFEAMALGRPVVSTTLGVEGLDITPGEHYLAADDAASFAGAILNLMGDGGLRRRLADAARARVEARFGWPVIARQFEAICLDTIARRP